MSEQDPLLPQDPTAPEIRGQGFRPASAKQDERRDEENNESDSRTAYYASLLKTIIVLLTAVISFAVFLAVLLPDRLNFAGNHSQSISARVEKILKETPLIDGHNDLAIYIRFFYGNKIYNTNFTEPFESGGLTGHVDLPRMKAGKVGGAFWSAYTMCPADGMDFSDENYVEAVTTTYSQIDLIRRLTEAYPHRFTSPMANSTEALQKFKAHGKFISPIGIEGLHQIGNSYANLRSFESLGARYATLTHNCHNKYADAALITNSSGVTVKAPPYWGGVSTHGQELVMEMNRLGMLVDISHVSKDVMLDVLGGRPEKWNGSASPVMFSHSSSYHLCPHPRNVPDDVLQLVKKTNSIVMVNFAPEFISCLPSTSSTGIPDFFPQNSTLHQVARHIIHIGSLIGYDHVGIGSDFDGIPNTPKDLDDVSKYPALISELLELGVSDEDAAKIAGKNILRVWADAEKTAAKMRKANVKPAEDEVKWLF